MQTKNIYIYIFHFKIYKQSELYIQPVIWFLFTCLVTLNIYYLSFQKGFQKIISKTINYKLAIDQVIVCTQCIHDFFIVSFDKIHAITRNLNPVCVISTVLLMHGICALEVKISIDLIRVPGQLVPIFFCHSELSSEKKPFKTFETKTVYKEKHKQKARILFLVFTGIFTVYNKTTNGKKIATLRFHKRSKGTTLFFDTFSSLKVDCTSETDFRPLNSQTTKSQGYLKTSGWKWYSAMKSPPTSCSKNIHVHDVAFWNPYHISTVDPLFLFLWIN